MLREILENIASNYTSNPAQVRHDILYHARKSIRHLAHISDNFRVYGGTGQGTFAQVPWIAVVDKSITTSVQRGYYVVYLFNASGKGVYLSLNQGWTDYQKKYGISKGRKLIEQTASYCQKLIHSSLADFSEGRIVLDGTTPLARGYEAGHICGRFYPVDNVPMDRVLINDLRNLMGIYAELAGLLSEYNVPIIKLPQIMRKQERQEQVIEDMRHQDEVEASEPQTIPIAPQPKPDLISGKRGDQWRTNPGIAKGVVLDKNHLCEFDKGHKTFTSKRTNHNYVETHHLIPMKLQKAFENSLDVPANIVSLCPTCHRLFHHALFGERTRLIQHFYAERKDLLKRFGIEIGIDELLEAYK